MVTAIVPCAGRGTRLRTLTRHTPKELLPLRGKPLLQWTLEEAAAAGIQRAVVVTSPAKPGIDEWVRSAGPAVGLSVMLVSQPEPRGLGDAITCARALAGSGDVALMLPDNAFDPPAAGIGPVLAARRATGCAAVLLAEIARAEAGSKGATGIARCIPRADGWVDVTAVDDKGATSRFDTGGGASAVTPIGRAVFGPDLFDLLEEAGRTLASGAELDDVPVLQRLAAAGRLVGVPLQGRFYDVGVPEGYAAAQRL